MKAMRLASLASFSFAGFVMLSTLTAETGCSSSLAQPFEQMKGQPITIHRLQNFEPPTAAPAQPGAAAIPGIPPQIQQWVSGAASMLPPGLIPPGLIPGTTPTPAQPDAPKFYNFRILGSVQVSDSSMRDDINKLFGTESSFEAPKQSCMYAEFGFSIGNATGAAPVQGAPPAAGTPADILVSLSCDQVQLMTYAWPYSTKTGLTADTSKKIIAIVQKAFGG
jgi:hypothetical protein